MNRPNKNNHKNKNKNKNNHRGKGANDTNYLEVSLYRGLESSGFRTRTFIVPNILRTKMRYIEPSFEYSTSGGVQFFVKRWSINDVYDPDPTIGGGTVSGYPELSALYKRHRVLSCAVEIELASEQSAPQFFGLVFTNTDVSSSFSSVANCQNAMEGSFATQIHMLSDQGGMDRKTIKARINCAELNGAPRMYLSDVVFNPPTGSSPSAAYLQSCCLLGWTNASSLHFGANISLTFEVEWTERVALFD